MTPRPDPPRDDSRTAQAAVFLAFLALACGGCRAVHRAEKGPKVGPGRAARRVYRPGCRGEARGPPRPNLPSRGRPPVRPAGKHPLRPRPRPRGARGGRGRRRRVRAGHRLRARRQGWQGAAGPRRAPHRRRAGPTGPVRPGRGPLSRGPEARPGRRQGLERPGLQLLLAGPLGRRRPRLSKAVAIAPDDARIRTNLGLAQAAAGDLDKAFETLSLAGGPAAAHANLGYILAASGREDEARNHYASALRLSPDFGPARQALAQMDRATATRVASTRPDPAVARASAPPR